MKKNQQCYEIKFNAIFKTIFIGIVFILLSNKSSANTIQYHIVYQYELHGDGCFYLYRIGTFDFPGGDIVITTPLNRLNYIGITSICSMIDTIDDFC